MTNNYENQPDNDWITAALVGNETTGNCGTVMFKLLRKIAKHVLFLSLVSRLSFFVCLF